MTRMGFVASPIWTVKLLRYARYALYLSIVGMIWWVTSDFAFVRLEKDDASVVGVSGLRRVLADRIDSDEAIKRGTVLIFAIIDEHDRRIYRVSRLLAGPADLVGSEEGFYTVNGRRTAIGDRGIAGLEGVLPDDRFFVVNDTKFSDYADSFRLGWIPRDCIIGRFLCELPF